MNKLKQKRNLALFGIILLVMMITGIFAVSKIDRYKGLVKLNNTNINLLADVSNIKGTDEVTYKVSYTLDKVDGITKRDVVIRGNLNSKYARFNSINNSKVTSNLSNDGKTIDLTIKDVPLGKEQTINLTINVVDAPNNEEITPDISIKEATGDYTKLNTNTLLVQTNSIEGTVHDENSFKVGNIELSLNKNGTEIKRTYTDSEGYFVFTDLEEGNYTIEVEEDIYDLVNDSTSTENNTSLILLVKQVDKFNLETHKYIKSLKLLVDGKEKNYSYEDAEKVVESIKSFSNISGRIEYKIVIKNNSDRRTEVKEVIDELQDGLSFDENNNPGWKKIDNKIKYIPLVNVILEPFEKREINIILNIDNASELSTFVNKITTKGDISERVIFILDGEEIRNITVLEGNKITKPSLDKNVTWYTDVNKTIKYNFNNEVTKDLILYATSEEEPEKDITKYKITYLDGDDKFFEEEVEENTSVVQIEDTPSKPHKIFLGWYLNDELYDFNSTITEDIILESKYEEVTSPELTYSPNTWTNERVMITIPSEYEDYSFMYRVGDSNYISYSEPFAVYENTKVYAYAIKNNIVSQEVTLDISNIDKNAPIVNQMSLDEIKPASATFVFKMIDNESGINKYKIYLDNTLLFESLPYGNNETEEKTETYQINGLDELSSYRVKLEVIDIAGNSILSEETINTPARHYVARTLNYQNEEIEKYESLKEALDSDTCTSDCFIEMIDDVNESNTISNDQNIKIDLNGKTITGVNAYAITNNGTLNIVDYDEENIGKVLSSNIAIKNNNFLQIGENETELVVSTTTPVVEGSTYAVDNNGTLKFYDGILAGTTPVHGTIDDTPYLYNANIYEQQGLIQIAKLDRIANAVARVNSIYYTEAQTAVNETVNGTIEEVDYTKPLIKQLKSNDNHRFVYDEVSQAAVNTNKWSDNTLAHSYIKIDLTKYNENQILKVNAEINSSTNDCGYVTVTESIDTPSYNQTNGRFVYISGNKTAKEYQTFLEKGKVYYLHIGFRKTNSGTNYADMFKINSISLGNFNQIEFSNLENVILYNDSNYYGFDKQPNGTYINNNNSLNNASTAHSYFVVDLTNVDENKNFFLNLETTGMVGNDRAWVTVNSSFAFPDSSNTTGRQVYIYSNQSEKRYNIELQANTINVVHICFTKIMNSNSNFILKSIKPYYVSSDVSSISDGQMVNNGDYYFERQADGSYKSNNAGINGSVSNSYMVFDLTDKEYPVDLSISTIISSESNYDIGYITLRDNASAPDYNDATGRYYYGSGGPTNSTVSISLPAGKISYLHFGYRKDSSVNKNDDCFIIKNLYFRVEDLQIEIPNIDLNDPGNENYHAVDNIPVLNEEPDIVQLIRNVTLTESLEVTNTRNVILDLNGKTLTTSSGDYVIKNNGKLKIIDSDYKQRLDTSIINYNNQQAIYDEIYDSELDEYNEALAAKQAIYDTKYEEEMNVYNSYLEEINNNPSSDIEKPYFNNYTSNDYIKDSLRVHLDGRNPENTSSTWKNLVPDSSDGEVNGATKESDSYYFDGNGDYVYLGDHNYEYITLEAVLDIDEFNKHQAIFVNMNYGGYQFDLKSNGQIRLSFALNYRVNWASDSVDRLTDNKVYYAATYDGVNTKIYINGVNVLTSPHSGNIYLTEGGMPLMIGGNYTNDSLKGHIYSARVYNRALTEDEIKHNYNIEQDRYLEVSEVPKRRIATSEDIGMDEPVREQAVMDEVTLNGNITSTNYHVILNNYDAFLDIDTGNVILDKNGNYNAITNRGKLTLGENAFVKTLNTYNRGIANAQGGDILDGQGTIILAGTESKGILNNSIDDTNIKGYTINSLDYRTINFYNLGYHDMVLENITSKGSGIDIYQENDNNLTVKNSTLASDSNDSLLTNATNVASTITFDNCTILNRINNVNNSLRKIVINNSNLNVGNPRIINGSQSFASIYNVSGEVYVNNTNIHNSGTYGLFGYTLYSIYNKGLLNINGGNITLSSTNNGQDYRGIYNDSTGTISIKGNLEIGSNYKYGIYNLNTFTLGDNTNAVSSTYPLVGGSIAAIYTSLDSTFNYYDGKLVGPINNTLNGIISNMPSNHDLNVTKETDKEIIVLKSYIDMLNDNDYVAGIGSNKYVSIQSAIDSVGESSTPTEIKLIKDVYSANTSTIPANKNITINQNNHLIKSYNDNTAFINNGILSIKDDTNDINYENISIMKFVINNGIFNYDNVTTRAYSTCILITNNESAKTTIDGGTIYSNRTRIINNSGEFIVNNGHIYSSRDNTAYDNILIYNTSTGNIKVNGGTLEFGGLNSLISNDGRVEVDNPTVYLYGASSSVSNAQAFISNNNADSYAKINGGTYGLSQSKKFGMLINNKGTAEIGNVTSNFCLISSNTGNLTINGGTFNTCDFRNDGRIKSSSGTLTINGSTITAPNSEQIYIYGGEATITGTTINYLELIQEGTSKLTLINNNVNNKYVNALSINGTGETNIISGTYISETKYGVNITNAATLNIGTKGGEVSKVNPVITGKDYGLYNGRTDSTVNFYDGVISGTTAIFGRLSNLEEEYDVILKKENDIEIKYLDKLPVVQNKRTGEPYYSVSEAITEADNDDTLELLREYTVMPDIEAFVIPQNKIINFDLKGFKIYQNNEKLFINNGTLSIESSEDNGIIETNSHEVVVNNGTLTINSGTYHQTTSNDVITNNEGATLIIEGGTIYSARTRVINNSGDIVINGGHIYSSRDRNAYENILIYNASTGNIIINGGTLEFGGKKPLIDNYGRVEAINPTVNLYGYFVNYQGQYANAFIKNNTVDSYARITGGTYGTGTNLDKKYGMLIDNNGTAEIINVTSNFCAIAKNAADLAITGGNYYYCPLAENGSIYGYSGTTTIDGITMSSASTGSMKSIYASGTAIIDVKNSSISTLGILQDGTSKLTLTNTNVTATIGDAISLIGTSETNIVSGNISSTSGRGINISNASTITIGTKGGDVSKVSPSITGNTYGLYNGRTDSTVNFYDGVISGPTSIFGTITNLEDGYEIILNTEAGVEHKYLDMLPVVQNKRTGEPYTSFQLAITEASNGDTLELVREFTTTPSTATITIPQNKMITIDLMGFKINQNNETLFINNGDLTIETSGSIGKIESLSQNIFINNGVLTINGGIYHQATVNNLLQNNEQAKCIINDGTFYSARTRIINNSGELTINGGNIYANKSTDTNTNYLIDNNSTGSIILNGGTLEYGTSKSNALIKNMGRVEAINPTVHLYGYFALYYGTTPTPFIENSTSSSYAKISGGTYGTGQGISNPESRGILIRNAGTAEIENVTSNLSDIAINTGTLTINGGTYNLDSHYSSYTQKYGGLVSTSGTVNLNNNITLNSLSSEDGIYIEGTSNLNVNGTISLNNTQTIIYLKGTGVTNIISGSLIREETYPILISNAATLNIGTLGGEPSLSDPYIQGKAYGIYKDYSSAIINFYDGIIKGESSPVYGSINDYEPGYKEDRQDVIDPNTGNTVIESTLTIIGSESAAIIVNNINFISIQSAVNYAVNNSISTINLHKDVTLSNDLIKPDGIDVNIYLNGHTLNQNGYSIGSGINLISDNEDTNNLGASIFTSKTNYENIVIYQMNDGSRLEATNTYKLFKLVNGNYEPIKLVENKIGNYVIGNDTTDLRSVDGKLYISNISEGNYELTSSDGNIIDFEILSDGVSSNIRINNKIFKNRVIESFATVILQIQTGKVKLPYMLIDLVLIIFILGLLIIKKHKRI